MIFPQNEMERLYPDIINNWREMFQEILIIFRKIRSFVQRDYFVSFTCLFGIKSFDFVDSEQLMLGYVQEKINFP